MFWHSATDIITSNSNYVKQQTATRVTGHDLTFKLCTTDNEVKTTCSIQVIELNLNHRYIFVGGKNLFPVKCKFITFNKPI